MEEVLCVPQSIAEVANAGISSPADLVPVRAGLASFNGGPRRRTSPIYPGGASVFRPLSAKGRQISNPPILPGAFGILWPLAA